MFAPAACDTSQTDLLAAFVTWVQDANAAGKRFCAVFGGLAGETISTAATRSGDCADPNILNVGGITITDEVNGPDGGEVELGGKELAPRIAGILAARGEYGSITAARLANTVITVGPSLTELVTAFDKGVVTLARDSHSVAPVYIAVGLNTFTEPDSDTDRPYLTYRQPKYIRTMQGIETELTQFAVEKVIGLTGVGDNSRDALVAECKRNLAGREAQGSIQPGWTVGIDQDPPPTSKTSSSPWRSRSSSDVPWSRSTSRSASARARTTKGERCHPH